MWAKGRYACVYEPLAEVGDSRGTAVNTHGRVFLDTCLDTCLLHICLHAGQADVPDAPLASLDSLDLMVSGRPLWLGVQVDADESVQRYVSECMARRVTSGSIGVAEEAALLMLHEQQYSVVDATDAHSRIHSARVEACAARRERGAATSACAGS